MGAVPGSAVSVPFVATPGQPGPLPGHGAVDGRRSVRPFPRPGYRHWTLLLVFRRHHGRFVYYIYRGGKSTRCIHFYHIHKFRV